MRRIAVDLLIVSSLAAIFADRVLAEEPTPGTQVPQSLEVTVGEDDRAEKSTVNFLLFLPKDYRKRESWPLMLFLHGAGERGDNLQRVTVHGPPKIVKTKADFPFVVVSPQCPRGTWWQLDRLTALLDHVTGEFKIDADRIEIIVRVSSKESNR